VPPGGGRRVDSGGTIADVAVASAFVNLAHGGVRPAGGRWPRLAKYVATLIVEEQAFLGLA